MKRREFITLVGGAAAWPMAVRAQQPGMPVVGYLGSGSADALKHLAASMRQGLAEMGFVVGKNVLVEYRYANSRFDRLPTLAMDLVRCGVDVIIATPGGTAGLAAKAATSSIPIVFNSGNDPVELGLVASLNRPGGNLTGLSQLSGPLQSKRLEILGELVPKAERLGFLVNPDGTGFSPQMREVQEAARVLRRDVQIIGVRAELELEVAFTQFVKERGDALLVGIGPLFLSVRDRIVELAIRHRLPAMYPWREFTEAGGLVSYATNLSDMHRQLGVYAGRILKGEKPADLPIAQPTKFELVINLKTAKALGLTVPPMLLARADEVIE